MNKVIVNKKEVDKFLFDAATKGLGARAIKGPGDGHAFSDGSPMKQVNIGWECVETGDKIWIEYADASPQEGYSEKCQHCIGGTHADIAQKMCKECEGTGFKNRTGDKNTPPSPQAEEQGGRG